MYILYDYVFAFNVLKEKIFQVVTAVRTNKQKKNRNFVSVSGSFRKKPIRPFLAEKI